MNISLHTKNKKLIQKNEYKTIKTKQTHIIAISIPNETMGSKNV